MRSVCAAFCLAAIGGIGNAAVIHVDADAVAGANDGSSWADAYLSFASALADATIQSGDEIWVAEGVYKPTAGVDRAATFRLVGDVQVYGGFDGTESDRQQRDPRVHEVILSGDIAVTDVRDDNVYHVVTGATGATLDGFTITLGCADGGGISTNGGGGMFNFYAYRVVVANCVFVGNWAASHGGAVFNRYCSPELHNCLFAGNYGGNGGAVSSFDGEPLFVNCSFFDNRSYFGDAVYAAANLTYHYTELRNCIAWSYDTGGCGYPFCDTLAGKYTVTYCCVQGSWPGQGNLDADPLPASPGSWDDNGTPADISDDFWVHGDYHLLAGSPCVDAADGDAAPLSDIEGRPRFDDAVADSGTGDPPYSDIGVYEYSTGSYLFLRVEPPQVTEGDGTAGATGSVMTWPRPLSALDVPLVSSDPGEASVPAVVVVPADMATITFDVSVPDDNEIDGEQSVTLTATAAGRGSAEDTIRVLDDESQTLTVAVPSGAAEGDGTLSGQGQVSIPGTWSVNLDVDLTSNDTSELTVPTTVTILQGDTSTAFDLDVLDDGVCDGTQNVTVTATAAGWAQGAAAIDIHDNDTAPPTGGCTPGSGSPSALALAGAVLCAAMKRRRRFA